MVKSVWVKYLAITLVGSITVIGTTSFIFNKTQIPQNKIKSMIEKDFVKRYNIPLKIESISGNFFTSIQFKNVSLHYPNQPTPILTIKKASLSLNPLKLLQFGGFLPSALRQVKLIDPTLSIHRYQDKTWNVEALLPKEQPQKPIVLAPFYQEIIQIKNLTIHYQDDRGWKSSTLHQPFIETFSNFNGKISLQNINTPTLIIKGIIDSSHADTLVSASVDPLKKRVSMDFSIEALDLQKWGKYTLPVNDYTLGYDLAQLEGNIRSNTHKTSPFLYDLQFKVNQSELSLPFFEYPIKKIQGLIHLYRGSLTKTVLKKTYLTTLESKHVLEQLHKHDLINSKGFINDSYTLPNSLKNHQKLIKTLFKNPPHYIEFNNIQGTLNKIAIEGKGNINFNEETIYTTLTSQATTTQPYLDLFPTIASYNITGSPNVTGTINGPLKNPIISGSIELNKSNIYTFKPSHVFLNYTFKNNQLSLTTQTSAWLKGALTATSNINFNQTPITYDMTFVLSTGNIQENGVISLHSTLKGNEHQFNLSVDAKTSSVNIGNQSIQKINFSSTFIKNNLEIGTSKIYINHASSPINLTTIHQKNVLLTHIVAAGIPIANIDTSQQTNYGIAQFNGLIEIPATYDSLKTPLQYLKTSANISINNLYLYDQLYSTFNTTFSFHKNKLTLSSLQAENTSENIQLSGSLINGKPKQLRFKLTQVNLSKKIPQTYIPSKLKPLSGLLTATGTIEGPNNISIKSNLSIKNATLINQPLEYLKMQLNGSLTNLHISNVFLKQKNSIIYADSHYRPEAPSITLKKESLIYLEDFQTFTNFYGALSGSLQPVGTLVFNKKNPKFNINFQLKNAHSIYTFIPNLSGTLSLKNHVLTAKKLLLTTKDGHLQVDGALNIQEEPTPNTSIQNMSFTISTSAKNMSIKYLHTLAQGLSKERNWSSNITIEPQKTSHLFIKTPNFDAKNVTLFSQNTPDSSLHYFNAIKKSFDEVNTQQIKHTSSFINGKITGFLKASSRKNNIPYVQASIHMETVTSPLIKAKKTSLTISPQKNGNTYFLSAKGITIGQTKFDQFESKGLLDKNYTLKIKQTDIHTNTQVNRAVLSGQIPLESFVNSNKKEAPLNLTVYLEKNEITALSIFNSYIQNITNEGHINLHITGTLSKPIFHSNNIFLKNTHLHFVENEFLSSALVIPQSKIRIKNNTLSIPKTDIIWTTDIPNSVHQKPNVVTVEGSLSLPNLSFKNTDILTLNTHLTFQDTHLHLNFPNTFQGEAFITNMSLKGDYPFTLTKKAKTQQNKNTFNAKTIGPIASGNITLSNGSIKLSNVNKEKPKPTIQLNIPLKIGKNIYINQSLLGSGLMAGISTELELDENTPPLTVQGTINTPLLTRSLKIKTGTLNLFNREFKLLPFTDQKKYSEQGISYQHFNSISFKTGQDTNGKETMIPVLDITALTTIEASNPTPNNREYHHVVVHINGPLNNLQDITFEVFKSSQESPLTTDLQFQNKYVISQASHANIPQTSDTYELLKILMPEFFSNSENSGNFISKFSENRINLILRKELFRPLEKQIAKKMGLYDLKIDYNLGNELLSNQPKNNDLALSVMQRLISEQLFVRVKTEIDLNSETQQSKNTLNVSEIELIYYLFKKRNMSINYANIKDQTSPTVFKPKLSLRFSHDF